MHIQEVRGSIALGSTNEIKYLVQNHLSAKIAVHAGFTQQVGHAGSSALRNAAVHSDGAAWARAITHCAFDRWAIEPDLFQRPVLPARRPSPAWRRSPSPSR